MRHRGGRFELKFLIDFSQKDQILESCRKLLKPDHHGDQGAYRVNSQYFDTPQLRCYYEKLDGIRIRQKYRLRFYGRLDSAKAFFMEIKHREGPIIRKERVRIGEEHARRILEGDQSLRGLSSHLLDEAHELSASRLEMEAHRSRLKPTAVVSYLREAWVGTLEPGLRLTFDQFCCGLPAGSFHPGIRARQLHSPSKLVMELKFNRVLPSWMTQRVNEAEASPIRFSKYAKAIEALPERHFGRLALARRLR